ncbi:MAG: Fur family transcriptional regulator, partial [Ilumatobacteraceae bacterium]
MRSPVELAEAFRSNGLKLTPQRQLIFQLLDGNQRHPTADELFAEASSRMPGISLRTVYQTLNDLVAMGELSSHTLGGGATRFDPNTSEHHHLVCTVCRSARDVAVSNLDALEFAGNGLDRRGFGRRILAGDGAARGGLDLSRWRVGGRDDAWPVDRRRLVARRAAGARVGGWRHG